MAHYGWALWLCVPVVATALAAIWTWWRDREPKLASTRTGIAAHQAYLAALTRPPAGSAPLIEPSAPAKDAGVPQEQAR
jgi:hypothetical protein